MKGGKKLIPIRNVKTIKTMKTTTTILTLIAILFIGVAITMGIRSLLKGEVPIEPTNLSPEYAPSYTDDQGKG
jgi:hypothetical protein